jgi:hypothetical protein
LRSPPAGPAGAFASEAGAADADAAPATDAAPGDAAAMIASGAGGPDAGATAGPVDPGVIDLRPFVPPGMKVVLVLRTDRLRATPWASRVDALLAPMPDHRLLIAGSGLDLVETFDVVVIASPAPRDVTQTFLAGRTGRDRAVLRRLIDRPERAAIRERMKDPRVLMLPLSKWFALVRPEHLPEDSRPPWLEALGRVDEQTGAGDAPTVAVVTLADLGPRLVLPLPGAAPLPAPERLTMAVHFDERGLVLTGAAVFPADGEAAAFVRAVEGLRRDVLGSLTQRLVLRSLHAEGLVTRLSLARQGGFVTFSTSLSNADALLMLEQAALWAQQLFAPRRE